MYNMASPRILMCEVIVLKIYSLRFHNLLITNLLIIILSILSLFLIFQISESSGVQCNSNNICMDFLNDNKLIVDINSEIVENVVLYNNGTSSDNEYEEIQREQGFCLEEYYGKILEKHSYELVNYPDGTDGVYVNIFLFNGKIVAADICSVKLNGFIHGVIK